MTDKDLYFDQLDRTIGFVRDCDNKTSIVLAAAGIILTVIVDQCGKDFICLVSDIVKGNSDLFLDSFVFIILLTISLIFMILGIWTLLRVLIPAVDTSLCDDGSELNRESLLFAVSIADLRYDDYKSKLLDYTDEDYINDILSQIYINSKICTCKYKNYKRGLILSVIGLVFLVISGIICETMI